MSSRWLPSIKMLNPVGLGQAAIRQSCRFRASMPGVQSIVLWFWFRFAFSFFLGVEVEGESTDGVTRGDEVGTTGGFGGGGLGGGCKRAVTTKQVRTRL